MNRLQYDPRLGKVATVGCGGGTCPECGEDNGPRYGIMGSGKPLLCDRCYNADNPAYEPDLMRRLGYLFFDQKLAD